MSNNNLCQRIKSCLEYSVKSCFPQLKDIPLNIEVSICRELNHGDFYSNLVLKLMGLLKKSAEDIGQVFLPILDKMIKEDSFLKDVVKKVDFRHPGFINFFLSEKYLCKEIINCIMEGDRFGSSDSGKGCSVLIEFVSANPTGPLSIAHGRQAAIGDALANIFSFLGYRVEREYYINDEGIQMYNLAKSIWVRFRELMGEKVEFPEDGYRGEYIIDIARKIPLRKDTYPKWNDEAYKFFFKFGSEEILNIIKQDLANFGVKFDNWINQSSLINSGQVNKAIEFLEKRGFIYRKEGALWLKSTSFGDDKDRVVVKSDGNFTYIASDIAYHRDKYERGFDLLINLWGPDHHGYIARLRAAIKALGYDEKKLKILIVQLATLYREGKVVPMSTRAGNFVTLEEVVNEIGKDVARFFFLSRRLDSHLDFDITLAKKESAENPVYYIQYAHARINSLREYAHNKGLNLERITFDKHMLDLLLSYYREEELNIIRLLQQFPYIIKEVEYHLEPNILIVYLQTLAKAFHRYYASFRIIDSELEKSYARILMALAVGVVIRNGLRLLGISFPEKM